MKRGGALDNEAYARGTSVYFPDRVLPMLPEELSNGACSLNEGEDRYALSCFMEVNGRGEVVRSELCESVIRSRNRMTYTKVAAILAGDAETVAEYADIVPLCTDMAKLSASSKRRGAKRGGIDLDVREAHISREGEEVKVEARERNAAHRLIEAFMILANETVARFLEGKGLPVSSACTKSRPKKRLPPLRHTCAVWRARPLLRGKRAALGLCRGALVGGGERGAHRRQPRDAALHDEGALL